MSRVVAIAGSRALPPTGHKVVARVTRAIIGGGCRIVVGCAQGADAACISAALDCDAGRRLSVMAAFGQLGQGASRSVSNVYGVSSAVAGGAAVTWWAGGGESVPLAARLARRTRAVVGAADAGLVVVMSSPMSRGSLLAARTAAARGLSVVVVPMCFAVPPRDIGAGRWVQVERSGVWSGGWSWVADNDMFGS